MATEERPTPVRYWPKDEAVSLDGNWQNRSNFRKEHQLQQQQNDSTRCTPMTILKISLPIIALMLFAVPVITVFVFRHIDRLSEYGPEITELPDVTNLRATDFGQNHFIMSWTPPLSHFDYYLIESYDVGNVGDISKPLRVGSCSYGTVIHRDQSEITCDNLKACANISITVHTKVKRGIHDATSTGTKLEGVLIPGREPDSPKNLKIIHASAKVTRIQWEPPSKVSGRIGHIVSICHTFTSCNEPGSVGNCTERETSEPWFDLQSSGNSKLCVLVRSKAECGAHVFRSHPVAAEVTPSSYVLPDAGNLTLVDIGPDCFTVSWMHPVAQFDYYWLEVYQMDDGSGTLTPQRVGSCANGTSIHREQTQITCDMFKPCSNVTITLHTQAKGTSELRSPGATLQGIFMPGKDIPEVTQLKLTDVDKDSITVSWQRPDGCFDGYIVEVAQENSGSSGVGGLSAGSCAGGITVDAQQTSITCRKIEACSVKITVRTQRKGQLKLTSPGVSLHDIVMYEKDIPEVLPTLAVANDTFVLRWNRPTGCFDKYNLEVTYQPYKHSIFKTPRIGSCVGTTVLEPDVTSVTCSHLPACVNTSVILRTQQNGPHGRVSRGEALFVYSETGALVDFDLYLSWVTKTTAGIEIDTHRTLFCPPHDCWAFICQFHENGARSCWKKDCEAPSSDRNEMFVKLKNLTPGGLYECRVALKYNDQAVKRIAFNTYK